MTNELIMSFSSKVLNPLDAIACDITGHGIHMCTSQTKLFWHNSIGPSKTEQ